MLAVLGLTGRLAADNSVRNPSRTATTANALVIGLFLVTLVTVSGEAMKSYVVGEFNKLSSSDFVLGAERSLAPELVDEVDAVDGVTGVAALRFGQTGTTGTTTPLVVTTTGDIAELGDVAGMAVVEGSLDEVIVGRRRRSAGPVRLRRAAFGSARDAAGRPGGRAGPGRQGAHAHRRAPCSTMAG